MDTGQDNASCILIIPAFLLIGYIESHFSQPGCAILTGQLQKIITVRYTRVHGDTYLYHLLTPATSNGRGNRKACMNRKE